MVPTDCIADGVPVRGETLQHTAHQTLAFGKGVTLVLSGCGAAWLSEKQRISCLVVLLFWYYQPL